MYPTSQVPFGSISDRILSLQSSVGRFSARRFSAWHVLIGLMVLVLTLLTSGSAQAATNLEAPVKMLMKGHKHIAVLKAVSKADDSRITFEVQHQFYGEIEPEVVVRLDPETYTDVREGQTYVVGFSNVRRNFRFRELREIDPEGYRVVTILGGGPALLDDSPEVRLLFDAPTAKEPPTESTRMMAALTVAGSENVRTQSFGVLELSLRSEWLSLFDTKSSKRLRDYLGSRVLAPDSRGRLFELAEKLPASLTDPWLAKEARRTLGTLEPQFDLTTFFPRLAQTVLGILEASGSEADKALVAKFLEANNPGVVEAALGALDHVDPALALERAKVLLERNDLHAESRRLLKEYVG